jgi:hypothetical protein
VGGHLGGLVGGALVGLVWRLRPGRALGALAIAAPLLAAAVLWSLPQLAPSTATRLARPLVRVQLERRLREDYSSGGTRITTATCAPSSDALRRWTCRTRASAGSGTIQARFHRRSDTLSVSDDRSSRTEP